MARYSKVQSDFSGGLISDYILGRLDIKRVANSARVFKNFFPSLQGPAVFRSGFKHVTSNSTIATINTTTVAGQANSNRTAGSYNAVSSTSSGFGVGATFNVVVDASTGNVSTLTLVSGGQGYAVDDTITIADTQLGQAGTAAPDLTFTVATVTSESTSAYKSIDVTLATDVPYRAVFEPSKIKVYDSNGVLKDTVTAPYSDAVIPDLRFSSETDALYITHGLYKPAKLTADLITVTKILTATDGADQDILITSDGFQLSSGLEVQGDDSWTLSDLEFDFEPILSPEPETKSFKISSNKRIVKIKSSSADFAAIRAAGDGTWETYYVEYEAEGEKFLGKVIDAALGGNYTEVTDPAADGMTVYVEPVESIVDIQDDAAQLYLLDSNEVNEADASASPLTGAEQDKALDLDGVPTDKIHLRCDTVVFNLSLIHI